MFSRPSSLCSSQVFALPAPAPSPSAAVTTAPPPPGEFPSLFDRACVFFTVLMEFVHSALPSSSSLAPMDTSPPIQDAGRLQEDAKEQSQVRASQRFPLLSSLNTAVSLSAVESAESGGRLDLVDCRRGQAQCRKGAGD
jgi:hypothetical protein